MTPEIHVEEAEPTAEEVALGESIVFVRFLHITDEDGTHTIRLPQNARIVWPFEDNDPQLRIEPGEGFEEFQEDDGLIGILPFHIVEMARMEVGGLKIIPHPADASPPTQS